MYIPKSVSMVDVDSVFLCKTSCVNNEQAKNGVVVVAENKKNRIRPLTVKRFPRRVFLQFMGFFEFNSLLFLSQPASLSAAALPDMNDSPEVIR